MHLEGFVLAKDAVAQYVKRILISITGRQKLGKSHFALTAPAPIAYLNFDKSSAEDVLPKFVSKIIYTKNYWPLGAEQEHFKALWNIFLSDYETLLKSDVKTMVLDTGSEIYNICRMALLGRLTQVMPHRYAEVNAVMRDLINKAYSTDKNLVVVHKLRKEYLNDSWTGKYEMSGFGEIPYLVQTTVEVFRDDEGVFGVRVAECSTNADLRGLELMGDMCNIPTLGMMAIPGSKEEDWL